MILKQFMAGPIEANNYLLVDETSLEAVIIDCSEAKPEMLEAIQQTGAKVKHILLTHGHFDHVMGVNQMKALFGCDVLINENDVMWLQNIDRALEMFGLPSAEIPKVDGYLKDGDTITFGNHQIKVIHTPGHSEGSVSFLLDEKELFSGDTLFKTSIGRTDLPGGDWHSIKHSIKNILFNLDDETIVYPGHGDATSIRFEKKFNREL